MRRIAAPTLAAVVVLLAPAPAPADTFDDVFAHYRKAGRVDPCRFSAAQLERARRQVPNDIEQYAPDFPDEIDRALSARARGACDEKAAEPPGAAGGTGAAAPPSATPSTPEAPAGTAAPAATTPQPTPQAVPAAGLADGAVAAAAARRRGDAGTPAALVVLAALLGTLLLWLLAWGAVRWSAWEPAWVLRARHATAEAGWRASGVWAEFTDWVRIGR